MATRTLYVTVEDEWIYEKAKELSGNEPYSKVVLAALQEYIANRSSDQAEIEIKMGDETLKFLAKRV